MQQRICFAGNLGIPWTCPQLSTIEEWGTEKLSHMAMVLKKKLIKLSDWGLHRYYPNGFRNFVIYPFCLR